ncbi:MAG: ribbon-helix-helix protein, CopG family [Chloroflexi bacterium]|nr:ribbon-helix-helix protein, CopG family [Chloroflexota bacterium]
MEEDEVILGANVTEEMRRRSQSPATAVLSVRIPSWYLARMQQCADRQNVSLSEVVREALAHYLSLESSVRLVPASDRFNLVMPDHVTGQSQGHTIASSDESQYATVSSGNRLAST